MISLNLTIDPFPYNEANARLLVKLVTDFMSEDTLRYYARLWLQQTYKHDKAQFAADAKDYSDNIKAWQKTK